MKSIFTLLSFFCLYQYSTAQKADLDRYNFTASFRDLPSRGMDTAYKTFSISTAFSQGAAYALRNDHPDEMINITGLKRLPSNGHIRIFARMEDVDIQHSEVKERIDIIKDKNGKETGRKYYYYTELIYTFACDASVTDFRGQHLYDQTFARRDLKKTYKTQEYTSYNEALSAFVNNAFTVAASITRLEINRSMNDLNIALTQNFGFPQRTVADYLWILDTKKHPEYNAHRQAWNSFKQAMFQMRADQPLDEVRQMMKPVISYFEKMKRLYKSDSKADRKIRYASYYNLAKIYYYLDDADASMREAGELMINDYDEKDGRGLEAAAAALKQLLYLNKTNTRHFPIYAEEYQGPGIVNADW